MKIVKIGENHFDSIIRYKGSFDLAAILKFMKKWMEDRDYSYYERKYKKKPDLMGSKYDITIEADKRINPYIKWFLIVRILVHDVEKKEVIENGKKVFKEFGRMQLQFDAKLQFDPDKRWETYYFKKLESFFHKHVVRWDIDQVWMDDLYYQIYHLKEDFARYMNMYYIG